MIDIKGQKFGNLIVLDDFGKRTRNNDVIVTCLCECGNIKDILINSLKRGLTKSCGCQQGSGSRKQINHDAFNILNEETYYWLGFLMADGCVTNKTVIIGLNPKDKEHLEKFKKFAGGSQDIYFNPNGKSCSFAFRSQKIIDILNNYNIVPCKSLIATPHLSCINNRHFWRGMIDGDGWISSDGRYPILGLCGSYNVIDRFCEYVNNIVRNNANIRKMRNIWTTTFVGRQAIALIYELYNGSLIFLDRKAAKAKNMLQKNYVNLSLGNFIENSSYGV